MASASEDPRKGVRLLYKTLKAFNYFFEFFFWQYTDFSLQSLFIKKSHLRKNNGIASILMFCFVIVFTFFARGGQRQTKEYVLIKLFDNQYWAFKCIIPPILL